MLESGVSHANGFPKQEPSELWRAWRLATKHYNLQLGKNALAVSHRKHPSHWWGLK